MTHGNAPRTVEGRRREGVPRSAARVPGGFRDETVPGLPAGDRRQSAGAAREAGSGGG